MPMQETRMRDDFSDNLFDESSAVRMRGEEFGFRPHDSKKCVRVVLFSNLASRAVDCHITAHVAMTPSPERELCMLKCHVGALSAPPPCCVPNLVAARFAPKISRTR